ncbi:MAG TPA: HEPN domain-containing protein [Solirubrobacterales bacterium]|nr:HEPN domain-containing protein [Solirubrobacterales bacterium]
MYERTLARLQDGAGIPGRFTLAELEDSDDTLGMLSWSEEDGATLLLPDPPAHWGALDLNDERDVYGLLADNTLVSLPAAAVRRHRHGGFIELTLRCYQLDLGACTERSDHWGRMHFRLAHMHEWFGKTGIEGPEYEHDGNWRVESVKAGWRPPAAVEVDLEGAKLRLSVGLSAPADTSPEQEFVTRLNLGILCEEPLGANEIERRFRRPMVVFSTLVADRHDAASEVVLSKGPHEDPVRALHAGTRATSREWSPGDGGYLFRAADCDDVSVLLGRWFELYERAGLPLAVFAETLASGNSYFPGRLIQCVTGLEAYAKATIGSRGSFRKTLTALQDHYGVDAEANHCTEENLRLVAEARNYYTHLEEREGYSTDTLEYAGFTCARWATALMQSCLLRELGFSAERSGELIAAHYMNWPLP